MRQLKITKSITQRETLSLNKYLSEVGSINLITQDDEISISAKIKAGDEKALHDLVKANLRFVISVAKQYQGSGGKLDDLIQAGNEGLINAAHKFDASRGFKFISYGVWWIRQSIMQFLIDSGRTIRLPSNRAGLVNKIRTITSTLEQELHRDPVMEEIVDRLITTQDKEFSPTELNFLMAINTNPTSLDMPIGEDGDGSFADVLITEPMQDVNSKIKQDDLQLTIKRILDIKLTPKEKDIITSYYGLFGKQEESLEEIGSRIDLTRERVRQIKEKCLKKLQRSNSINLIKEYL